VQVFTGTWTNKVDRKRRVSVPAQFRAVLVSPQVMLIPNQVVQAIDCWPAERVAALSESLDDQNRFTPEERELALLTFASFRPAGFDAEGRIMLSDDVAEAAALDETVTFVGLGKTFQIWNPDKFAAHSAALARKANQQKFNPLSLPLGGTPRNGGGR